MKEIQIVQSDGSHEVTLHDFMKNDTNRVTELINQYPYQIPVQAIAEWWKCDADSIRRALEQSSVFGIGFRQAGKLNRAFVIPTGKFVRWYLGMRE